MIHRENNEKYWSRYSYTAGFERLSVACTHPLKRNPARVSLPLFRVSGVLYSLRPQALGSQPARHRTDASFPLGDLHISGQIRAPWLCMMQLKCCRVGAVCRYLHDIGTAVGHVSWATSVPYRSRTTSHNSMLGSR